jgi:hypothetical protein
MVERSIINAVKTAKERNWDTLYGAIDLHDTIIPSSYQKDNSLIFYPYAKETLQIMTNMQSVKLILFTSSYPDNLGPVFDFFEENGILFEYFNNNPEVENTETGDFSSKFYYNFLIDDKAGFDANTEWETLYNIFKLVKEII